MHQAIDPGHICAQILSQPLIGILSDLDSSRINNDQFGTLESYRSFDGARKNREKTG
jgi:hypothetical protein